MTTVLRLLGVRPQERHLVLKIAAVFALIQSTHALGANSADALFFLRYGVENLPLMIVISGFGVMAALLLHTAGLGRRGAPAWLPRIMSACAMLALAEWLLSFVDNTTVYPIIWVTTQVLIMVTFAVMWNAAATVSTTRQAKRLFPIYASAGVAGAVLGNLATGPLASILGTANLLGIQGLALLGSVLLLVSISDLYLSEPQGERLTIRAEFIAAIRTVRASRLLKLSTGAIFGLSALFYLVVFPFNEVVAISFETEAEIAGFLGLFASVATGLTFMVSLLVTNRLFSRFGVVAALLLVPIIYIVGFGLWLGSFSLNTAAIVRASQWIAVNAVGGTATTAVFNVLTGRRRGQVMSFMTAVPAQVGIIAGGAILMIASGLADSGLFLIGLVLAFGALMSIAFMMSAYVDSILEAVRKGLVGVFGVPHEGLVSPFGRESALILSTHLNGSTPEERLIGLIGLRAARDPKYLDVVVPLQDDEDPRVRIAAFDTLCASAPSRLRDYVAKGLSDESPVVRNHVLASTQHLDETVRTDEVAPFLGDPDPAVRATAARIVGGSEGTAVLDELLRSGEPRAIVAALETAKIHLETTIDARPFVTHADPSVRIAALQLGPEAGLELGHYEQCLEDPSMSVRRISAETLAKDEAGRGVLLEVMKSGSVSATEVALRALTPVDRFSSDFISWAQREARRATTLAGQRKAILAGELSSATTAFLAEVLDKRSKTLSDWVILAMTTSDNTETMTVVERGLGSRDPETRAQAIEALDMIGDKSVTKVLLDLLEAQTVATHLSQEQVLENLTEDFDPWIRTLAANGLRELAGRDSYLADFLPVLGNTADLPNLIDRVIALQRVAMFSSLDPEDLQLVAAASSEAHYTAGERIYRAGDDGTEMMVILDGEACVTTEHGGSTMEVTRYGPGEHVGELALLQGSTRSADVHAGDEGVSALVIAGVDLASILQERPQVAMAMLGTLASRLAAQT